MIARNRRTGSPIAGTFEALQGRADTAHKSFQRDADGNIQFEHEGTTKVFWDAQETARQQDEIVFLDEDGEGVVESEVELVNDLKAPLTPLVTTSADDWPDLRETGRQTRFYESVTLYEVVHADGSGHGLHATQDEAAKAARPSDRIAATVYKRTDEVTYDER